MTKAEIIEYLYDNNVRADITIEQMAEDLADRKNEPYIDIETGILHWCGWKYRRIYEDKPQTMLYPQVDGITPSVIEPQTDTEIAKEIVHTMIDDAVIAEDAYPDLRQKMHDAVDEYEPQTDEPPMDEYYKDHDEFYDCDRYVITNDEGERAYNCIGCQTDCAWK